MAYLEFNDDIFCPEELEEKKIERRSLVTLDIKRHNFKYFIFSSGLLIPANVAI